MRPADRAHRPAWAGVALLALTCAAAPARAEAAGPEVRRLSPESIGEWRGYTLGGHRIEGAFVSEPIPLEGAGFQAVVELDVRGPDGRLRAARCTWTYAGTLWRFTLACDVRTEGSEARMTLVLDERGGGHVRGPVELDVAWRAQELEVLALSFARPDGARVAEWSVGARDALGSSGSIPPGGDLITALQEGGLRLLVHTSDAATDEAIELAALMTLLRSSTLEDPNVVPARADTVAIPLDAYPLASATAEPDPTLDALIAAIDAAGARGEAALLRAHASPGRRIDRGAGPYVVRHPGAARVAVGLSFTTGAQPSPNGPPGAFGGGRVEVFGGVRIRALLLGLTFGLGVAPLDGAAFASTAGLGGVSGALFSVGLDARYAVPLFAGVEGVLGLGVTARLRLTDVTGWTDGAAAQFGLGVAPVVGLQAPLWRANALGTRLVLALEGAPEFGFWQGPGVRGPVGQEASAARLDAALSGTDIGVALRVGLRFEL